MIESQFQEWYKDELMPSDEELNSLEHYGIKGQKWGVRRTPEQLGHITEKKRKVSNWIEKARKKSAKRKRQAAKKKAAAKKAKAEKEEESEDKIREKVLNSTDPKYIYKYRHLLTTKELQDRLTRIDTEAKVKKLTVDDKAKKTLKSGEETLKSLGAMAESIGKIADAYNKIGDARAKAEKREEERYKRQEEKRKNNDKKSDETEKPKTEKQPSKKSSDTNTPTSERISVWDAMASANETVNTANFVRTSVDIKFDPKTGNMSFEKKKTGRRGVKWGKR